MLSVRRAFAVLVTAAVGCLGLGAPAGAAPSFQGEHGTLKAKDNRAGSKAPTARQRDLAARPGVTARFNALGTPELVKPERGPLAAGLPSDPEAAARQYLRANRELFGLSEAALGSLELVSAAPLGSGHAVLLRQRFGTLDAGVDGLVTVGLRDGRAEWVSSSLARDVQAPAPATISAGQAVLAAARDAGRGISAAAVAQRGQENGWTIFGVDGLTDVARVRTVAVPTPAGARTAHEVLLMDQQGEEPLGVSTFVDARSGAVLVRQPIVDYLASNPTWDVFTNTPPMNYASTDTRQLWCWDPGAPGCVRSVANAASPLAWDVSGRNLKPTFRTEGNNARSTEKWFSNDTRETGRNYSESATRDYAYAWTNQWFQEGCNPSTFTSPRANDIDAATANLFAMHNRMHDWTYRLGFTEEAWNLQDENFGHGGRERDPEHGNAQAGGVVGGPPSFASRDNANQFTPVDGVVPVTNMYLWQPIAAGFYAPCVDGDFDMSVIGHEYGHAVSNRMVAGPDGRLLGNQGNGMGESWSDLQAVEYLAEHGFAPLGGENRWAVGPYVTGDKVSGIRNYGMNVSPLNYSDIAYDLTGPQVHADGEIWSATQFGIRQAFNARYDGAFPSGNAALQLSCAEGGTPVQQCPGNRRWIQLVFDAWLLMARGDVSFVDARDAMLAADRIRFGGANQDLLWNGFAARGLGEGASSNGTDDPDPKPSFSSPLATEGTVRLAPAADAPAELFIGHYEARAVPVADTDPATMLGDTVALVPGRYDALIRAKGHGIRRLTLNVTAGGAQTLSEELPRNYASSARGATATGDGINLDKLIDDTEATQWASLNAPVAGRQATVRLDPSLPVVDVDRVQVSAHLRPINAQDPGGDTGSQSRYSALRSFQILACHARGNVDCTEDADFRVIFTSPDDAFPSVRPRPRAPELITRSFDVRDTVATHVRLRVLTNQCTGAPDYAGEQDQDPRANTDCATASTQGRFVRAAELQVFDR